MEVSDHFNRDVQNQLFDQVEHDPETTKATLDAFEDLIRTFDPKHATQTGVIKQNEDMRQLLGRGFVMPLLKNYTEALSSDSVENLRQANYLIHEGKRVAFVANHLSEFDPLIWSLLIEQYPELQSLVQNQWTVIGDVVGRDPLKNAFAEAINHFFVVASKENAFKDAKKAMAMFKAIKTIRGKIGDSVSSLFVHPSGGRSRVLAGQGYIETKWEAKTSEALFRHTKVDTIIPVGLVGTHVLHSSHDKARTEPNYLTPTNVYFEVGKPQAVEGKFGQDDIDQVYATIKKQVDHILDEHGEIIRADEASLIRVA